MMMMNDENLIFTNALLAQFAPKLKMELWGLQQYLMTSSTGSRISTSTTQNTQHLLLASSPTRITSSYYIVSPTSSIRQTEGKRPWESSCAQAAVKEGGSIVQKQGQAMSISRKTMINRSKTTTEDIISQHCTPTFHIRITAFSIDHCWWWKKKIS